MSERDDFVQVIDEPAGGLWEPMVGSVTEALRSNWVPRPMPTEAAAETVVREACNVLSQCTPPNIDAPPRTGLICGYVQSGKTASMTAVSALAKDNGFRLIILLAGMTTILVSQNRDRLVSDLRSASREYTWVTLENPRLSRDGGQLESLVQAWSSDQYEEGDRRTLFISVMKNHRHLRGLADFLSSVDLSDASAIVFDDEADQASLNTRPRGAQASTTYRMIDAVRQALPRHSYLQYTATPQAPLLITRIDSLSADFAELLSPGDNYVGGRVLFEPRSPYVELIPPSEVYKDGELPTPPPRSLKRALQQYFVGVAAAHCTNLEGNRSMLIHPSMATATHQHYLNWVIGLKGEWHRVLERRSNQRAVTELLSQFKLAHDHLATTSDDLPPFDEIQNKLLVAMGPTTVTLVNSKDASEVPWDNGYAHILVGGEKLGRGYTIKGLTVTYMPRSPGGWTADTIQQRARFFGYRAKELGYCRIHLHPRVRDVYEAYVDHEEDMRQRLREHQGRPLQEWRRLFYLDRRLAPTRRNVLTSPFDRPRLSKGWFSPDAPQLSPGFGADNLSLIRLFDGIGFEPHPQYAQHEWAVVPLDDVFEQVLAPYSYLDAKDALKLCFVNCNLKTLLERDSHARCLVYRMDRLRTRNRELTNGRIPQFFQGRSSAGANNYPGDRDFCDSDLPTIQVHMLRAYDEAHEYVNVPAVAVHLPTTRDMLAHDEQSTT
jgi:Z1 domain